MKIFAMSFSLAFVVCFCSVCIIVHHMLCPQNLWFTFHLIKKKNAYTFYDLHKIQFFFKPKQKVRAKIVITYNTKMATIFLPFLIFCWFFSQSFFVWFCSDVVKNTINIFILSLWHTKKYFFYWWRKTEREWVSVKNDNQKNKLIKYL